MPRSIQRRFALALSDGVRSARVNVGRYLSRNQRLETEQAAQATSGRFVRLCGCHLRTSALDTGAAPPCG